MHNHDEIFRVLSSFKEVNKSLFHILQDEAGKLGITGLQVLVLKVLVDKPHLTLAELAEQLHSSTSTMSGVVDRLVKNGYVRRERSESDRRSLMLSLTQAGIEKEAETYQKIITTLAEKLRDVPEEELEVLLALHDKLLKKLK
ncbi:MarR family transcriptional regulator [Salsuginibacillus kocurii]|uniref:MarR family transcriptional regulator n=1 Tax=Salsuginibacillus kocurii TaxID=427078 RepID=UPI00035D8748|nr:MarR family transcriptional regulator [Salsuginibacillus kocurii]